ncbi:hypothetical protein FGADI_12859 [Fusarium gaditjirri]|uniref:Uncharacterized protein n=1 Tax=Fusarium gaditjirri TaxID=282569 RepID=A0A8H4SR84_9HYPO|nr:hypothetical protein FGADI_12859 [Fusarium gaditjirri]
MPPSAPCKEVIIAEIKKFPTQLALQKPAIQDNEVSVILASVEPGVIEAVGVSLFVYPYERYKKKLIAVGFENFAEVASVAFTANTFNSKVDFQATFPNSEVLEWKPPNDKAARSFVADSIRNSFAHGQSALIDVGGGLQMVDIWNSQNGEYPARNFHIRMLPQEFWQLAQQCMRAFISNAVDHQTLVPFETLLLQVQL